MNGYICVIWTYYMVDSYEIGHWSALKLCIHNCVVENLMRKVYKLSLFNQ